MAGEFLSSKIVVQEEEPRIPALPTIQTAVLAAMGKTVRGALNTSTTVTSFEEFARSFGTFRSGFELPLAIRSFFLQGGRVAKICRAGSGGTKASAIFTSGTPASGTVLGTNASPFVMTSGTTVVASIDGGGNATATFTGTAALINAPTQATYLLANNDTLTLQIDGGSTQTVTFVTGQFVSIAAATAPEICAVINAAISGASASVPSTTVIRITSDKKGTASSVHITGGTANASGKLNFSTTTASGGGNVANIAAVTATEAAGIINSAISGQTTTVESGALRITSNSSGTGSTVAVQSSSTANTIFGLDTATHTGSAGGIVTSFTMTANSEGTWANTVRGYIKAASSGVGTEFNLEIEVDGFVVEKFANVNVGTPGTAGYLTTVVNHPVTGSIYCTVAINNSNRPTTNLVGVLLTSGAEPTVADADIIGDTVSGLTGMRVFDTEDDITLMIAPDGATPAVQNAMIQYAEITRNRQIFCVLDSPAGANTATILSHVASLTASEQAALYWPRVQIPNPNARIYGTSADRIVMAASGHIAGVIARNDATRQTGPFTNPANIEDGRMFGVIDLESTEVLREEKRDLVFPKRINPIVFVKGTGFFPDGARTLLGSGNFPSVGERRGVSIIEQTAKLALQFAKNKANTEELRDRVESVVTSIIMPYVQAGCLASKDFAKAAFVDVSEQLNSASIRKAGKLLVRMGLATAAPAEFILLLVSQDTRALQEELLGK